MAESGLTIRSDSEQYSGEDISMSPPSSSSPAVILYQPPTLWSLLRGATINLFLPFVNGMMLGFGELFAHEAAFRLGWSGTRVRCDALRMSRLQEARRLTWKMARSFPFHDDKHTPSGPGSRLWTSQSRGSGWTTSRAWNEQVRPGHEQCRQAQGILYLPVPLGVGPGLGGQQQSRWSPWGSMLETTDTRGWVVVAENMPAAYQRRLDVLHLYIQQNRISLAYQSKPVCK